MSTFSFRISWSRNAVGGRQAGQDTAHSLEEAVDIAKARLLGGGIPATARISEADSTGNLVPVRDLWKDFDARIGWQSAEGKPE